MSNSLNMEDNITEVGLDLCIEADTVKDEQKQLLGTIKKAMTAGLFYSLENEGPNGMPLLHLKGEKAKVMAWILKNYDEDFEADLLDN